MCGRISAFVLCFCVFLGSAGGQSVADIGSVSAVNRDMNGTRPTQATRNLTLGNQVVRDERIQTSDIGSGQIIFLDQTSISIAPRSDMVLDSYIYDPEATTGEVSISLTKGALRFIGGRITKSRDAIIKTPTATIGIRGGMSIIQVADDGATSVIQIAGERTTVTGLGGKTVTLSRSSAKAEVSSKGDAKFSGLARSEELAPVVRSFEGGGSGGTESGSDEAEINNGTGTVAQSNSKEQGGAERKPVSTSGEKTVEKSEREKEPNSSDPKITGALQNQDTTSSVTTNPDSTLTSPLPTGGAFMTTQAGEQTFASVTQGSLIGTTASGDVLHLPIPESTADFDNTLFGVPKPSFRAELLYPNTGFNEVDFGQGASLTAHTNLGAFGFSDLGIGFHVYQIGEGPGGSGQEGLVLFGTPTPGQIAVLAADSGTLPATTNTASTYLIEPELELGGDGGDGQLLLIANGGERRFSGLSAAGSADGGKVLSASARIDIDPGTGEQFSDLSVFANSISSSGGGPRLDGEIFQTEVGNTFRLVRTTNVGMLSDQNGNTAFGPNGRYLFAVSPMIPGAGGGFVLDAGEEHLLGLSGTDPEPVLNLLTLDPGGTRIESQPLVLAQHSGSRASGSAGFTDAQYDGLHAAAFGACSDSDCGALNGASVPSGLYAVRTGVFLSDGGAISFENGLSGTDTNEVVLSLGLEAAAAEVNTNAGGNTFSIPFGAAINEGSAYLDDEHFAISSAININAGGEATNADFLLASSALAGDAGIFIGQNPNNFETEPVNARWGWWSASFDVVSGRSGSVREDLFHMGAWVAGVRPDPTDMPVSGVVGFGGVAIGTEANLATSVTRVVGGDFELNYDFGIAQGNFRMNIAGLSINDTALGEPGNSHAYQVNVTSPVQFQADGTFFSGVNSPVAATGGDFQIDDFGGNRQIVGVFVGDATSP